MPKDLRSITFFKMLQNLAFRATKGPWNPRRTELSRSLGLTQQKSRIIRGGGEDEHVLAS